MIHKSNSLSHKPEPSLERDCQFIRQNWRMSQLNTTAFDLGNKEWLAGKDNYVSPKIAADFLGISETFLTRLARNGQIPAHPLPTGSKGVRRTWRFRLGELREFMEQRH